MWSVFVHLPDPLSTVMGEDNRGSRKHNGFALQVLWPSKDPIYMMFEVRSRMTYRNGLSLLHRTLLLFKALIQIAFRWLSEASYRSPVCFLKCINPHTVEIKVIARVERDSHGNWLFLSLYTSRNTFPLLWARTIEDPESIMALLCKSYGQVRILYTWCLKSGQSSERLIIASPYFATVQSIDSTIPLAFWSII